MIERWILLAGEEGGPSCNKLGGIWNVIDAEADTLASLASEGSIDKNLKILVLGPHYPTPGSDWHTAKNRVTDLSGLEKLSMGPELDSSLSRLESAGIKAIAAQRRVKGVPIGYVLFNTTHYQAHMVRWKGQDLTLDSAIKTDAYQLVGLDSMQFERSQYGGEYSHYLELSYAISELVRDLATGKDEETEKYRDKAVSEFAKSLMPKLRVSLHCHEFGVFYAIARLKKMGVPVRTAATLHATVPGRTAGHRALAKVASNDSSMDPGTPQGFALLESMAKYADAVTFVGDSTMKEAMLFYHMKGVVIRNGIDV
jgi:hypothetical protein